AEAMRRWSALETQATEMRLRLMATSGDVAAAEGCHTVATWLARETRVRRADASADLKLAVALDRDLPVLAAAVREARVNIAQAKVIATAVEEIPTRVGRDVIAKAEAML